MPQSATPPAVPTVLTLSLALALAACAKPAPAESPAMAAPPASAEAAPPAPPQPPTPAAAARKVSEHSDLYEFDYAYPAQAAAIPALRQILDADLDKAKAELVKDASDGRKDAKENDFPFHAYSHSTDWQVVTDLPGWLSLSTLVGFYTGGAHPNYVFDAILWDKAANTRRAALDLFTSKAALSAAIARPFCAELDRQRTKKRGGEDLGGSISEFDKCIDPLAQTVILGSASRTAFDRIGFLIAPYEAGPYAEGSYEVTLPVTPAVLAAVKPEYRAAFAAR
ncbi:DUF3298 and DUF4163 domain-containing protein [Novosphingobium sp. KCTC 2891]|uniref:DUF4163 domain-containing protein n=1 Tax=Novosphingobium sp. KCTC 2891 TaxID=2989730 RepID=UPI002223C9CE|nr:DUF3298 and DUF4163 domain-containing protein [Novosphingobium sp. KCTC 2891]MCW1381255.1 DUF3298 and DUF4163 domain-containing protein [Novosphingobium sp. KCTC 2891]